MSDWRFLPPEPEPNRAPIPSDDYIDDPLGRSSSHRGIEVLRSYERGRRAYSGLRLHGAYFGSGVVEDCSFDNCDLRAATFYRIVFAKCTFRDATLQAARLDNASFIDCSFESAVITEATFVGSKLTRCNLVDADLSDSLLDVTTINDCDLTRSRLTAVRFTRCDISRGVATGCDLRRAVFIGTPLDIFANSIEVTADSDGFSFDWQSVVASIRAPHLDRFLAKSLAPDLFVIYMTSCARALDPAMLFKLMRSTFISYGGPDVAFARRLQEALQRAGVKTFFFEKHAVPGTKLHDVMRDGVNTYDRVILICSEASLERPGVLTEIEQTLAREARDGGATYLVPLTIDDHVFKWAPTKPGIAQEVRDRVVADFRGAADQPAIFEEGLRRLLGALAL